MSTRTVAKSALSIGGSIALIKSIQEIIKRQLPEDWLRIVEKSQDGTTSSSLDELLIEKLANDYRANIISEKRLDQLYAENKLQVISLFGEIKQFLSAIDIRILLFLLVFIVFAPAFAAIIDKLNGKHFLDIDLKHGPSTSDDESLKSQISNVDESNTLNESDQAKFDSNIAGNCTDGSKQTSETKVYDKEVTPTLATTENIVDQMHSVNDKEHEIETRSEQGLKTNQGTPTLEMNARMTEDSISSKTDPDISIHDELNAFLKPENENDDNEADIDSAKYVLGELEKRDEDIFLTQDIIQNEGPSLATDEHSASSQDMSNKSDTRASNSNSSHHIQISPTKTVSLDAQINKEQAFSQPFTY